MAATITATGTWSQVVPTRAVGGVGVAMGPMGTGTATSPNLDSRAGIQTSIGGYAELNQYIAAMASGLSITAIEAMDITLAQLHDLRRAPQMGEHVYAP